MSFLDHQEIKKLINLSEDLENESYRTPIIHNHLNVVLLELKKSFLKDQNKFKKKYKEKWEYYTGKSSPEVYKLNPFPLKILKSDIHLYLESDSELSELQEKLDIMKYEITFLEETLKSVNQRTFLIKTSLDYKKFLNGG